MGRPAQTAKPSEGKKTGKTSKSTKLVGAKKAPKKIAKSATKVTKSSGKAAKSSGKRPLETKKKSKVNVLVVKSSAAGKAGRPKGGSKTAKKGKAPAGKKARKEKRAASDEDEPEESEEAAATVEDAESEDADANEGAPAEDDEAALKAKEARKAARKLARAYKERLKTGRGITSARNTVFKARRNSALGIKSLIGPERLHNHVKSFRNKQKTGLKYLTLSSRAKLQLHEVVSGMAEFLMTESITNAYVRSLRKTNRPPSLGQGVGGKKERLSIHPIDVFNIFNKKRLPGMPELDQSSFLGHSTLFTPKGRRKRLANTPEGEKAAEVEAAPEAETAEVAA